MAANSRSSLDGYDIFRWQVVTVQPHAHPLRRHADGLAEQLRAARDSNRLF